MDTTNLNNEIDANQLIPTDEIIKLAKESGVKFGFGDTRNRIRYLVKNGLLPHQVRKVLDGKIVPHLPYLALAKLVEIQELQNKFKYTIPQLISHFNDAAVKTERSKYDVESVKVVDAGPDADAEEGDETNNAPVVPAVAVGADAGAAVSTPTPTVESTEPLIQEVQPVKSHFGNVVANNKASEAEALTATKLNIKAADREVGKETEVIKKSKNHVKRYVIIAAIILLALLGVIAPGLIGGKGISLSWLTGPLNDRLGFFRDEVKDEIPTDVDRSSLSQSNVPEGATGTIEVFGVNIPAYFSTDVTFGGNVNIENQNINLGTGQIVASNVIYSIIAGEGMEVSAGQNPVITNIGVLSVGGATGDVELEPGEGIEIDGTQITNIGVLSLGGETGELELEAGADIDIDGLQIALQPVIDTVTQINLPANSATALRFGDIGLGEPGTSNTDSGAYLIGVFDEFDNTNETNLQALLEDFDNAITVNGHDPVTFVTNGYDYITLSGQQITLNAIDLTTDVTGFLPTANGGLGADVTAAGAGEILYSTGTTTYDSIVAGNVNQILTSGGAAAPSWNNITALISAGDDIDITGTTAAVVALEDDIEVSSVSASTENGISFMDNGGNLGIFIEDGGFVGIGTTHPASQLSVGDNSQFIVNSSGNITRIGGVNHSISNSGGNLSFISLNDMLFDDSTLTSAVQLADVDVSLPNGNIGIVDAINDAYEAATGGGSGGLWTLAGNVIYPTVTTNDFAIGGTSLSASMFSIDESAGIFEFGSDNSANPALRFEATDSDQGEFGFNTNDSFYFTGANVGIGTSAPLERLTLTNNNYIGSTNAANNATIRLFGLDTGNRIAIAPAGSESYFGGNLGIGTTDPESRLTLAGGASIGSGYTGIGISAPTQGLIVQGLTGIGSTNPASQFTVGANNQFQVDTTGNIVRLNGLVVSFPSVQGASGSLLTNNGSGVLSWSGNDGTIGFWQRSGTTVAPAIITDSLGVGTTAAESKFTLAGNASIGAGYTGIGISAPLNGLLVQGNVGIGNTNPSQKLSIAGTLGILEGGASPQHYTVFQGGDQSGNITYTLPTTDGEGDYVMTTDGNGVLSWQSAAGVGAGNGDITAVNAGSGLIGGGTVGDVTLNIGSGNGITVNADSIEIKLATTGGVGSTASFSGLEVGSDGLSLLTGCGDDGVLMWNDTDSIWECAALSEVSGITGGGTDNYIPRWNGSSALNNSVIYQTDAGNVGIGTTGPESKLAIVGGATIGAGYTGIGISAPTMGLLVQGNVGIGNTNPFYKLDVNGDVRVASGSDFYVGTIALGHSVSATASGAFLIGAFDEFGNSDSNNVQAVLNDLDSAITSATHDPVTFVTNGFDYLTLADQEITLNAIDLTTDVAGFLPTANGGLGANVTAAGAGEILYSTGATAYDSLPAGNSGQILVSGGAGAPSWANITSNISAGDDIDITGTTTATVALEDAIDVSTVAASSASGLRLTDDGNNLGIFIEDGGQVGIGNATPSFELDVTGTFRTTGNLTFGDAGADTVTSNAATWTFANDTNFVLSGGINGLSFDTFTFSVDATNDRIGIGTTAPESKLAVAGGATFGTGYTGIGISAPLNGMLVQGNVGIGNTNPRFKLDVTGTARVRDLLANSIVLGDSNSSHITSQLGFKGFTNFNGGIGTGGIDSTLGTQRLTASGNLKNIGSIQAGETLLTTAGTFSVGVGYTAGTFPYLVDSGDINADGDSDVILGNRDGDRLSVYINNGNGTFASKVDYVTGSNPYQNVLGDVNGDSMPDAAVFNGGSDTMSIFINNGDGTFATKVDYTTEDQPHSGDLADFNNDGKLDAVSVGRQTANVSVFLNNGDGTFATRVNYSVGSGPSMLDTGDVNGDGFVDIITGNVNTDTVSVILNDGDGTFGAASSYSTGSSISSVKMGDLNGDGALDIVSGNSSNISVLINDGDGTFATKVDYGIDFVAFDIAIKDITGDGIADVVVPIFTSEVSVFRGIGDGTLAAKVDYAGDAFGVSLSDFNGDGKLDMAISQSTDEKLMIRMNVPRTMFFAQALTGRIGIGTTGPESLLTVAGGATIGSGYTGIGISAPLNGLLVQGNLGLGSTNPGAQLAIGASNQFMVNSTGNITRLNGVTTSFPSVQGAANSILRNDGAGTLTWVDPTSASGAIGYWQRVATTLSPTTITDNVGIGVTNSTSKLSVAGGVSIGSGYQGIGISAPTQGLLVQGKVGVGVTNPFYMMELLSSASNDALKIGNGTSDNRLRIEGNQPYMIGMKNGTGGTYAWMGVSTTGDYLFSTQSGAHLMEIEAGGNVGIGTTVPESKLSVAGGATIGSGYIGLGISAPTMGLLVQGNVGIGVTNPRYKLDVSSFARVNDLLTDTIVLSQSNGSIISAHNGTSAYTNFSGAISTGGVDSQTSAVRLTASGNLTNIGSIQAGQTLLTRGGTFGSNVEYGAGGGWVGVAAGDVNGDGYLDIAAGQGSLIDEVSIFTNDGDGTFTDAGDYPTGSDPQRAPAIGDLNGDGWADIVTANSGGVDDSISVLINNGDGTFATNVDYSTDSDSNPIGVFLGDLNADGKLDIVAPGTNTGNTTPEISVFINNGDGTFAANVDYATGSNPWVAAIGDVDNDGFADVVVGDAGTTTVSVFLNNGNGTLAARVTYTVVVGPVGVALADYNGDGYSDIATASQTGDNVSILMNDGDGTFAAKVDYTVGNAPFAIQAGDINGDGKPDLAVSAEDDNAISIIINNGNGTFGSHTNYTTDVGPRGLDVADLNGDGKLDLVAPSSNDTFSVVLAAPQPMFFAQASTGRIGIGTTGPESLLTVAGGATFGAGYTGIGISAPLNGLLVQGNVGIGITNPRYKLDVSSFARVNDLLTDTLILSQSSASTLAARLGFDAFTNFNGGIGTGGIDSLPIAQRLTASGNLQNIGSIQGGETFLTSAGTFAAGVGYTAGTEPLSVIASDVDGDSYNDLIVPDFENNVASVFINDGDGTFATKVDYATGTEPYVVSASDFNGDGYMDLVTSNQGANTVSVLINDGDGTYAAKVDYATATQPMSVTSGDISGDGKPDIVSANNTTGGISVLINNGDGTFATKVDYAGGANTQDVALGDFNGDGRLDIVAINTGDSDASIYINNGNGAFAAKVDYATGDSPVSVSVADVNGDRAADFVVGATNLAGFGVFINDGDGTFATKVDYIVGDLVYDVVLGDLNGDGIPDITINNISNTSTLINNGSGVFASRSNYSTGGQAIASAVADLNRDGKNDIATVSYDTGVLSVFINQPTPMFFAQASTGRVGIGNTAPGSLFAAGNNNQFLINSTGNITRLNGVTTSFPSSQGAANSILRNDGAGTLTWVDPASASGAIGYWQRVGTTVSPTTIGDNVGIGVTNSTSKLSVAGGVSIGSGFQGIGISAPTMGLLVQGNVGIGTTATRFALDVNGHIGPNITDTYDLGSDSFRFRDLYLGPDTLHIGTSTSDEFTIGYNTTNNYLGFNINGSGADDFVFDANGRFGIGTTSPVTRLHVTGGDLLVDNDQGFSSRTTGGAIHEMLRLNSDNDMIVNASALSGSPASLIMAIGSSEVLDIRNSSDVSLLRVNESNGRVGIGITAPRQLLSVGQMRFESEGLGTLGVKTDTNNYGIYFEENNGAETWAQGINVHGDMVFYDSQEANPSVVFGDAGAGVGIGVTSPAYKLDVLSSTTTGGLQVVADSVTTGTGANMSFDGLTTGTGLSLASTSAVLSTGGLVDLDWSPTGSTEIFATGDLFSINVGEFGNAGNVLALYDNASTLFRVSQSQIESAVPHLFSAAGDVSIANDLVLTNQTSSNINSYGPLTITSGESFENQNLALQTYGTGNLALNLGTSGNVIHTATDASYLFNTRTATDTDYWMGVIDDGAGDDDDIFSIGDGSIAGTNSFLTINTSGQMGLGTTAPSSLLHLYSASSQLQIQQSDATNANARISFLDSTATGLGHLEIGKGSQRHTFADGVVLSNGYMALYNAQASAGLYLGTADRVRVAIDADGSVGIGNTDPFGLLEVGDSAPGSVILNVTNKHTGTASYAGLNIRNDGGNQSGTRLLSLGTGFTTSGAYVQDGAALQSGTAQSGGLSLIAEHASGVLRFYTAGVADSNERMRITAAGNVGIGYTAAASRLSLGNDIVAQKLAIFENGAASSFYGFGVHSAHLDIAAAGAPRMSISSTGLVGIGTTTPGAELDVRAAGDSSVRIFGSVNADDAILQLLAENTATTEGLTMRYDNSVGDSYFDSMFNGTDNLPAFRFRTETSATAIDALTIMHNGNVGIGTSASTAGRFGVLANAAGAYAATFFNDGNTGNRFGIAVQGGLDSGTGASKLITFFDGDGTEVGDITNNNGTVSLTAFTGSHKGAIPEEDNEKGYPYGTVLCLAETTSDDTYQPTYKVVKCTEDYQKSVFGVYAYKDETKENEHGIYSVGDGHVLVTAENGEINRGDNIVASTFTGYGMKAVEAGTIVAVATADWDEIRTITTVTLPNGEQVEAGLMPVSYYPGVWYSGPSQLAAMEDFGLETGDHLVLDSNDDADTYFNHDADLDRLSVMVDGTESFRFSPSGNSSNGSISTSLSDLAESYPTMDSALEPGDVVVLDTPAEGETADISKYLVAKSGAENKSKVLGVVTSKPGLLMGAGEFRAEQCKLVEEDEDKARENLVEKEIRMLAERTIDAEIAEGTSDGDDRDDLIADLVEELTDRYEDGEEVLDAGVRSAIEDAIAVCKSTKQVDVALAGRIPVKYDTSNGEIESGDLLAVSEVQPGRVVKATEEGWVVGRALEGSNDDEGMLMMFVNLTWFSGDTEALAFDTEEPTDIEGLDEILEIQETDEGGKRSVFFSDMNITGNVTAESFSTLGEITAGFLKIDGSDDSISIIGGGDLKLQNGVNPGNIEAFNGELLLTAEGGIIAKGDIEAESVAARNFMVLGAQDPEQSASIGEGIITAGTTEVVIMNTNVRPTSKVFVTATTETGANNLIVSNKIDGAFVIKIKQAITTDIKFDYWIVGVKEGSQ